MGEPREGAAGCLGDPGMVRTGAGCAQQWVAQRLRDLQEELTVSMGMSLEIWWKSLRDLTILSPTFLVC